MKKILSIIAIILLFAGCQPKYELNTAFNMPTSLNSPSSVTLDVTSSDRVVFSWEGGGAADGGVVLYEVLFDVPGGDFSKPVEVVKSDQGAKSQLTLSHAELNAIARKAGIKTGESGEFIWTVRASKGGESKLYNGHNSIRVTRGEGIDAFPKALYLMGSAAKASGEVEGREFRIVKEGLYQIYTRLDAGEIYFKSDDETGGLYYFNSSNKIMEGEGSGKVTASGMGEVTRITVDFNSLGVKFETIGGLSVYPCACKWLNDGEYPIYNTTISYVGQGIFKAASMVIEEFFRGWDWCAATGEERYTIYVSVDGRDCEWSTTDSKYGATRPSINYGIEYFELAEYGNRPDWGNGPFKFPEEVEGKIFDLVIYTNKDNKFYHEFTNIQPYNSGDPIPSGGVQDIPSNLVIKGDGCADTGKALDKVGEGVFVLPFTSFGGGSVFFEGDGHVYYASSGAIVQGENMTNFSATPGGAIERLIVDFNEQTVTRAQIGEVAMTWGYNQQPLENGVLSYKGNGVFKAESVRVPAFFADWGWPEERFSFYLTIGDEPYTWGRPDDGDGENRPAVGENGSYTLPLAEFAGQDQWSHLWKLASETESSTFDVTLTIAADGSLSYTISNIVPLSEGVQHVPATLTIGGSAAETAGQPLAKIGEGIFRLGATALSSGDIFFTSGDGYQYYINTEGLLTEGEKSQSITATAAGEAERITLNFLTREVKRTPLNDITLTWAADTPHSYDGGVLQYVGGGKFRGNTTVEFYRGWDWCAANGEERYSFYVTIDGEKCTWGRPDSGDAENRATMSDGRSEVRKLEEFAGQGQWDHLWKAPTDCDRQNFDVEIWFDDEGNMWQNFSNFSPLATDVEHIPASLHIHGAGAETDGQQLYKTADGVFVLYATAIGSGEIYFSGDGYQYFISGAETLCEGNNKGSVTPTPAEAGERMIVDFNTKTVKRIALSDVTLTWAADSPHSYPGSVLKYVGGGKFRGETYTEFYRGWDWCAANGEERYSFYLTLDGENYTWGRPDSGDAENRATMNGGSSEIRELNEFAGQGQWDHLWKAPTDCDQHNFTVELWIDADGHMWHNFSNFSARE